MLEGHWWESLSDVPALPAAESKLHMVAAGHMPEGSLPGLLGFSRVPNGGASGSVATGMLARASAVGIAPKPPGKQEQGGHCSLMLFLPRMTTNGSLPFDTARGWGWPN